MKFFIARFHFADGDMSYPWTVWATNINAAFNRLTQVEPFSSSKEVIIRERTTTDSTFYGHSEGQAALEHSNVEWSRD